MAKNLYIGNMSYDTTEAKLRELFGVHGQVTSVNLITDQYSGRPKGFAFVEMETDQVAAAAIAALNGKEVDGRTINVAEARPRNTSGGGEYRGGSGGRRTSGGRRDW